MTGAYDMAEAERRLRAFDAAGADCLYVPYPPDMDALRAICAMTASRSTRSPLASLPPRRTPDSPRPAWRASGSLLARVTQAALLVAAREVLAGDFSRLAPGAPRCSNEARANRVFTLTPLRPAATPRARRHDALEATAKGRFGLIAYLECDRADLSRGLPKKTRCCCIRIGV